MTQFTLIDFLAAVVATVFVVAAMMVLPTGWVRVASLGAGLVGFGVGFGVTRRREWDGRLLLMPGYTVAGLVAGWAVYVLAV